jgi:CheY-like chemotaxis protein/anti-sigma regulatory factor (Ser/Thr protein kinase)
VFANVICNAAKYTDPGGHIAVLVGQRDQQIVVEVRDDGIGIDAALLPRIFDPFVQGEQGSERARGGLGLGLGLVRALVELHRGEVEARSPGPGRGSTFTVRLPAVARVDASPELDSSTSTAARPAPGAWRILVVDDNDDARMLLADVLRERGHDVRAAQDGGTALDVIQDFIPEIGLLDIGLPGMDGHELAAKLRRAVPDVRLIALSGYGQPADHARSRAAGFDRHLVKPVELRRLFEAMADLSESRSRRSGRAVDPSSPSGAA